MRQPGQRQLRIPLFLGTPEFQIIVQNPLKVESLNM